MSLEARPLVNIKENYNCVLDHIAQAARRSGRDPDQIRLVVVTKTHPIDRIQSVVDAGAVDLGENYVEEALPKISALKSYQQLNWHMIGHVQSRKAEAVCQYFQFLHSLDSLKLAERLDRFAGQMMMNFPVWLEFNLSGEISKSGWNIVLEDDWSNFLPEMEKILAYPHLKILGMMTMPPFSGDPENSRHFYRRLRQFQEFVIGHFQLQGMRELSIGMSSDYEIAIEEGSTCVRIGQAIMGARHQ